MPSPQYIKRARDLAKARFNGFHKKYYEDKKDSFIDALLREFDIGNGYSLDQRRGMAKRGKKDYVILTMDEVETIMLRLKELDELVQQYMQYAPLDEWPEVYRDEEP